MIGRRHSGRREIHPYLKRDFLITGEGQFWLGRESSFTAKTIAYFNELVRLDRIEYERREKVSYRKMVN